MIDFICWYLIGLSSLFISNGLQGGFKHGFDKELISSYFIWALLGPIIAIFSFLGFILSKTDC